MITCADLFGVSYRVCELNSNTFLDSSDCFVRLRKNSLPVSVVKTLLCGISGEIKHDNLISNKLIKAKLTLGSCNVSGNSPCQSKQICQIPNGLKAGVT